MAALTGFLDELQLRLVILNSLIVVILDYLHIGVLNQIS